MRFFIDMRLIFIQFLTNTTSFISFVVNTENMESVKGRRLFILSSNEMSQPNSTHFRRDSVYDKNELSELIPS